MKRKKPQLRIRLCYEPTRLAEDKGRARNNIPILHLIFSPSLPVLQSQNLETERLFLHFCSIRTNKYRLNMSARSECYYVHVPNLVTVYEKLCPDKKITLPGKPVGSLSHVNPPGVKMNLLRKIHFGPFFRAFSLNMSNIRPKRSKKWTQDDFPSLRFPLH